MIGAGFEFISRSIVYCLFTQRRIKYHSKSIDPLSSSTLGSFLSDSNHLSILSFLISHKSVREIKPIWIFFSSEAISAFLLGSDAELLHLGLPEIRYRAERNPRGAMESLTKRVVLNGKSKKRPRDEERNPFNDSHAIKREERVLSDSTWHIRSERYISTGWCIAFRIVHSLLIRSMR